jgi:oligosaccharide repeat unit polymerase
VNKREINKRKDLAAKVFEKFKTPPSAMLCTWIFWLILYLFFPFYYTHPVSLITGIFIILCLVSFWAGDAFGGYDKSSTQPNVSKTKTNILLKEFKGFKGFKEFKASSRKKLSISTIAKYCALVGIVGAMIVIISKLFLSGLNFSSGVTGARLERASEIASGQGSNTPILLYPGLFAFPFATCAFLICLLKGEYLSKSTQQLCKIAAISPVAVAVVNGGRGGIFYFVVMIAGAFSVRLQTTGNLKIPNLKIGKLLGSFLGAFLAYNIYIFETRREVTGKDEFWESLRNWEDNYGIHPFQWLLDLVQTGHMDGNSLLNWMQTHFYFTSGPSVLTQIIDSSTPIGPFFGQFQVGILASLLDKTVPSWSLTEKMVREANQLDIGGLIPSAWGMMILDFGLIGTLIEAFIFGWIARRIYNSAIRGAKLSSSLMFCFIFASIILSPIVAPLGFTDSCFTLTSILITSIFLNKAQV